MELNPIPVILYHLSEQIHVQVALRSAKRFNSDVIIITDTDCPAYRENARLEMSDDYQETANTLLAGVYRHMSTNAHEFEYSCIERWFAILEFMRRHQLREIFYIDSDVMTYSDYSTAIRSSFSRFDYCLCIPEQQHESMEWSTSAHFSYWTIDALDAFCRYVIYLYTDGQALLEAKWRWHCENKRPGGVCDMTLLYLFHRESKLRCGNLLEVTPDKTTFDIQFNTGNNRYSNEYKSHYNRFLRGEIKSLLFQNRKPYAFNRILNKEIRFHGIHFQGSSKKLMPFYERPLYFSDIINWTARLVYRELRIRSGLDRE